MGKNGNRIFQDKCQSDKFSNEIFKKVNLKYLLKWRLTSRGYLGPSYCMGASINLAGL